jgi:Protein of unknown function (DUF1176)
MIKRAIWNGLRFAFIAGGIGIVASPALAASQPDSGTQVKLGETKYYKDWAAGCDNGLTCEAVALMPDDLPAGMLSMVLARTAGQDGKLTINIHNFDSESDRYRLFIDGNLINTGPIIRNETAPISIIGRDGLKLANAIARGQQISLFDGVGTLLGKVSLAGSAAALRYLDSKQGRRGSASAIIARGRKDDKSSAMALPQVMIKRLSANQEIPETQDLVALAEGDFCKDERVGVTEDRAFSLGSEGGYPRSLVLISCGSGTYNLGSAAFVGTKMADGKWTFEEAKFDYRNDDTSENSNVKILINADWDVGTQQLSSHNKGRGIGDCGQSANYVWDGEMFRLTQARVMDACRGSLDWITVWRAQVTFDG